MEGSRALPVDASAHEFFSSPIFLLPSLAPFRREGRGWNDRQSSLSTHLGGTHDGNATTGMSMATIPSDVQLVVSCDGSYMSPRYGLQNYLVGVAPLCAQARVASGSVQLERKDVGISSGCIGIIWRFVGVSARCSGMYGRYFERKWAEVALKKFRRFHKLEGLAYKLSGGDHSSDRPCAHWYAGVISGFSISLRQSLLGPAEFILYSDAEEILSRNGEFCSASGTDSSGFRSSIPVIHTT
ncbi:hypothetical protein EDB86DRAFT_2832414 [Lactarius hatsudake]|nr:hypothetical protein EDB86DRAFT_2832414 [Lactarius hatsudake]